METRRSRRGTHAGGSRRVAPGKSVVARRRTERARPRLRPESQAQSLPFARTLPTASVARQRSPKISSRFSLATYTFPFAIVGTRFALLLAACRQVPAVVKYSWRERFIASNAYSVTGVPGSVFDVVCGRRTYHATAVPASVPFEEIAGITPPLSGK